jgi:translation initiation factor IF-3
MDYSKYKYDQEKKERKIKKNQHVTHLKQLRFKPHIGEGDYQVKIRQAIGFLKKKDKVKINLMFQGREMSHMEIGRDIVDRAIVDLQEFGQPEKSPSLEGRVISVVITPGLDKKV